MDGNKFYTLVGAGFLIMLIANWVCGRILAMKKVPATRAFWTVAPGYILVVALSLSDDNFPLWADIAMHLPTALALYLIILIRGCIPLPYVISGAIYNGL